MSETVDDRVNEICTGLEQAERARRFNILWSTVYSDYDQIQQYTDKLNGISNSSMPFAQSYFHGCSQRVFWGLKNPIWKLKIFKQAWNRKIRVGCNTLRYTITYAVLALATRTPIKLWLRLCLFKWYLSVPLLYHSMGQIIKSVFLSVYVCIT